MTVCMLDIRKQKAQEDQTEVGKIKDGPMSSALETCICLHKLNIPCRLAVGYKN